MHSFRVCHSHHIRLLLVDHRAGLFLGNDQTITIKKRCSRRVMDSRDSCPEFENKTVDMTRFVCLPPIRGQSKIFGQLTSSPGFIHGEESFDRQDETLMVNHKLESKRSKIG